MLMTWKARLFGNHVKIEFDYKILQQTPLRIAVEIVEVYEHVSEKFPIPLRPLPRWLKNWIQADLEWSEDVLKAINKKESLK